MCGGKGEPDDNGADNDNIKFQDNLPIGMTIMDFDTLTPSRYKNNNILFRRKWSLVLHKPNDSNWIYFVVLKVCQVAVGDH